MGEHDCCTRMRAWVPILTSMSRAGSSSACSSSPSTVCAVGRVETGGPLRLLVPSLAPDSGRDSPCVLVRFCQCDTKLESFEKREPYLRKCLHWVGLQAKL